MRKLSLSKNHKGQIGGLAPAILALVFAGIVLVFGIIMTQELRDTQTGKQTVSIINESITTSGSIGTASHNLYNTCGWGTWTASAVLNGTSNSTLTETTNYIVYSNGSIRNVTLVQLPLKVTYTYTWGGEACVTANNTTVGLGTFADFWEIIILAIVITVVIGLLLVIFGGGSRRR